MLSSVNLPTAIIMETMKRHVLKKTLKNIHTISDVVPSLIAGQYATDFLHLSPTTVHNNLCYYFNI